LAKHHPDKGFGKNERRSWEDDEAWQGFPELMLVAYDWAETFVALNVVAKPAIDAFLRQLGAAAEKSGDMLLKMLTDAQLRDSERSRRWTTELVRFAQQNDSNQKVIAEWTRKWVPLADKLSRFSVLICQTLAKRGPRRNRPPALFAKAWLCQPDSHSSSKPLAGHFRRNQWRYSTDRNGTTWRAIPTGPPGT
jgi:hypothetical protein